MSDSALPDVGSGVETMRKLLQHGSFLWVLVDQSGQIIESHLGSLNHGLLEEAIGSLIKQDSNPGAREVQLEAGPASVEVIDAGDGQSIVYLVLEDGRADMRLNRSVAMELLAGKVVHFYNNILTEFYGHISLLGRIYPDQEDMNSRLDRVADTVNRTRHLVERYMFMLREVKVPKDTVNVLDVLKDLKTILEPLFSPRIELELNESANTPITVCIEHQQLLQLLVSLCVAVVRDELVSSRVTISLQSRENLLGLCVGIDSQTDSLPAASESALGFVDRSLRSCGGQMKIESGDRTTNFVFLVPKFLSDDPPDSAAKERPASRKGNKSIVLLIDPVPARSDATKSTLEAMGFSVLDIAEGPVANEVFQAQPSIFEYVFIENSFSPVADEMKLLTNPASILSFGDGDNAWPDSDTGWRGLLEASA